MNGTSSSDEHLPSSAFFITMIFVACLCIIVGVIGNVGVIAYNIFMNHSKTPTTYFVVNLAISDVIVCLTYFPPWIAEFISLLTDKRSNQKLFCKVALTSSFSSMALSIGNLLAMNIDRYLFITKPLKYPRIMTWTKTYILLAVMWLLAVVNANFLFFNTAEVTGRRLSCRTDDPERTILSLIYFYLPLVGLLYFNYKMFKTAKNQKRKIRHESCVTNEERQSKDQNQGITSKNAARKQQLQQFKLVKTFSIILGVFFGCICPAAILTFIRRDICKSFCIPISASLVAVLLVGANSAINPFIYSSRNKEYRIAYRQLFSRFLN